MKAAVLNRIVSYGHWLPVRWMAQWHRDSPLLILRDQEVTLHRWLGDRFDAGAPFAQTQAGREGFARLLDAQPLTGRLHLLADMSAEELRTETVPRLRWANRTGLIEQRLERLFRQTPYRRADSQGGQTGTTEQILFSALTAPALVQPWLDPLLQRGLPIAGLWSMALLSRALMHAATPGARSSTHALWVCLTGAGQRQTYFHQGRTLVSRLIPHPPGGSAQTAAAIHAETGRTRQYLNTLRLLRREMPLEVTILCGPELADHLHRHPAPAPDCRMQPMLLEELAVRLGLPAAQHRFATHAPHLEGDECDNAEWLIAEQLLLHPPTNHYAPTARRPGPWTTWLTDRWSQGIHQTITPPANRLEASAPEATQRIGELLLAKKAISRHQLEIALAEQRRTGQPVGKVLIALEFIPEETMRDLLGEALEQETVDLTTRTQEAEALRYIPKGFARQHTVLPLEWDAQRQQLTVAMTNTFNMAVLDTLQTVLPKGVVVRPLLASESELLAAIDRFYGFDLSVDGILHEIETGEVDEKSLAVGTARFDHPMVRLVNALLLDAVRHEASDMHINPMAHCVQIRYRIDGVLQEVRILDRKFFPGLCVRIKVMGGMNIAESRIPQDGHFVSVLANTPVDFRLSTQPTVHGENIVLRLLNRSKGLLGLHELGLTDGNKAMVKQMTSRPYGIILVSGPTGCGKTTTLYALLNTLNAKKSNVMTLEDPVEYLLDAILQTAVNKAVDLDFSSGVRSILRQDPDIILVGEIRDLDTAQMALRAAMTGHPVYSTVHANSAVAAIPRLLNIGLRPDMLAGNIIGVLAQRLIRKLCVQCKRPTPTTEAERLWLGADETEGALPLYTAVGCPACHGTGYQGRLCVMEGLLIDDDFDDLISGNAPQGEYRRLARQKGMLTMNDLARRRVLEGTTSLEEVARVFGLTPEGGHLSHA